MIKSLIVKGIFMTNCFLMIDEETKHSFLIDPGADAKKIMEVISVNKLKVDKILITHGHFDHTAAAEELSELLNAPIYMHEAGEIYAKNPIWNLSKECGVNVVLNKVNYLKDNDEISLDGNSNVKLQVIHIPGHTLDGVIYYSKEEKAAFVGDTIFAGNIGTSRYYGGNEMQLIDSVMNKILKLPEETVLYSGHSKPTTVGTEKKRIYASL